MPLPRLELATSGFDAMLGFMHQPDEPKHLSSWEEVGNPLILHNNTYPINKEILLLRVPKESNVEFFLVKGKERCMLISLSQDSYPTKTMH